MSSFTCPYCGHRCIVEREEEEIDMKRGLLERLFKPREFEASRSWEASVAQPVAQPQVVGRPVVPRDPVMTRYVKLPLTAAVIFGLFGAVLLAAITAGLAVWLKAQGWWLASVPAVSIVGAAGIAAYVWFRLFNRGMEILEFLERLTGVDINADGSVGKPAGPEVIIVEIVNREGRNIRRIELPVKDAETLRQVAHAMLQLGCNLSKRSLAKHTPLSEEKALVLLAAMREKGLARFNTNDKPQSGTTLTKDGLDLFESLL
jgi:hypothetical protein